MSLMCVCLRSGMHFLRSHTLVVACEIWQVSESAERLRTLVERERPYSGLHATELCACFPLLLSCAWDSGCHMADFRVRGIPKPQRFTL